MRNKDCFYNTSLNVQVALNTRSDWGNRIFPYKPSIKNSRDVSIESLKIFSLAAENDTIEPITGRYLDAVYNHFKNDSQACKAEKYKQAWITTFQAFQIDIAPLNTQEV